MTKRPGRRHAWRWLGIGPTVALSLVPLVPCPCAWVVWSGVLGMAGLSFLGDPKFLFPLIAACATWTVGGLALASRTHGPGPFLLGLPAAVLLVAGKFFLPLPGLAVVGGTLLLVAALWSHWRQRRIRRFRFDADGQIVL